MFKAILTTPYILPPNWVDSLEYMLENGWQLFFGINASDMKTSAAFNANVKPYYEAAIDAGVTTWADLEACFYVYIQDANPTYLNAQFGAGISILESMDIEGYSWEVGPQGEVEWLRNLTTKKLWQWWGPGWYAFTGPNAGLIWEASATGTPPYYQSWQTPITDRMALVDYISYEFYHLAEIPEATNVLNFMIANYPHIPTGLTVTRGDAIPAVDWGSPGPWDTYDNTLQRQRLVQGLMTLKNTFTTLDDIMDLDEVKVGFPPMSDYCQFFDNLNLDIDFNTDPNVEHITATTSTNESITVPIGWNA